MISLNVIYLFTLPINSYWQCLHLKWNEKILLEYGLPVSSPHLLLPNHTYNAMFTPVSSTHLPTDDIYSWNEMNSFTKCVLSVSSPHQLILTMFTLEMKWIILSLNMASHFHLPIYSYWQYLHMTLNEEWPNCVLQLSSSHLLTFSHLN